MINVCILGATGSIGTQSIEVIRTLKDYRVYSMSCNTSVEKLLSYVDDEVASLAFSGDVDLSSASISPSIRVFKGPNAITKLIEDKNVDIVINAISGVSGLRATIQAIRSHKRLLLANKESLVCAGDIINKELFDNAGVLIPIDSEHSALRQCLMHRRFSEIECVTITASGGAFRDKTKEELESVTTFDALAHPTWKMGSKITIDSSTMANKGFEVIEAHHLFRLPYDKICTILHKESYVHAIATFTSGESVMVASPPDMKMPIRYALTGKEEVPLKAVSEENLRGLHFAEMDFERFPLLGLAYQVGEAGGIMSAVYCASNDVAVRMFLEGRIKYLDIERIVFSEVENYLPKNNLNPKLEDIYKVIEEIYKKYNYSL